MKLRFETSRTHRSPGRVCLFLAFLSRRASLDSSCYFAPRAFTIRSTFCRRGNGRENDDEDDVVVIFVVVVAAAAGSLAWIEIPWGREVARNGGISRSGEWNAYWISRKRDEGMSIAAQYLSSIAAAADADRVDAGNGTGVAIVTTMSRVQLLLHQFRAIRNNRDERTRARRSYRSKIRSRGSFLDFADRCWRRVMLLSSKTWFTIALKFQRLEKLLGEILGIFELINIRNRIFIMWYNQRYDVRKILRTPIRQFLKRMIYHAYECQHDTAKFGSRGSSVR